MVAEIGDLCCEIDSLAYDRDNLFEELARMRQSRDAVRANTRAAVRSAFEPVVVGECRKLRYLRSDDACAHAAQIAVKAPGESFNVYVCRVCPPYPGFGTRPFHVGHCRDNDAGAVHSIEDKLMYSCGCVFSTETFGVLWMCNEHRVEGLYEQA